MPDIPTEEMLRQLAREAEEAQTRWQEAEAARTRALDERARKATELEGRALSDFTAAIEEVRRKLADAVGAELDAMWEDLVPAVKAMATTLANTKAESANVFLAVNLVREHLWKVRRVSAEALGEKVPETTGDEHTALAYVERLIERLEENAEERSHLAGTINRLEEDVRVLHEGDETEAGTWKLHYIGLCQEIGIPRSVYGDIKAPKVDEIARYMGQVYTPLTKLCERVEKMEQRIRTIDPLHDISQPIEHLPDGGMVAICSKCNARYPIMTAFCPDCGENNRLNPKPDSEKP